MPMAYHMEDTKLVGMAQCSALPLRPFALRWHHTGCNIPAGFKTTGVYFMSHETRVKGQVSNEKKLNAGIKLVYRTYGPNLSTFFDAVQAEFKTTHKKNSDKPDARFLKYRDK
jgi:hypothetical protein